MNGIDLWLGYYNELQHALPHLLESLTEDEKSQSELFHFEDDRLRYVVTRTMVRSVLSRYADVAPREWAFEQNAYGRPHVSAALRERTGDLRFNVSHTRGLIVLGVRRGAEIGVDVENLQRQPALAIADRYFSPSEAAGLADTPPEQQTRRFFEYWTLKESYIKALGKGIAHTLERFSFDFPAASKIRLTVDPELGDDARRWKFWQFQLGESHLLAVCAERADQTHPPVRLFRTTSVDDFEPLAAQPLKTSGECRSPAG